MPALCIAATARPLAGSVTCPPYSKFPTLMLPAPGRTAPPVEPDGAAGATGCTAAGGGLVGTGVGVDVGKGVGVKVGANSATSTPVLGLADCPPTTSTLIA